MNMKFFLHKVKVAIQYRWRVLWRKIQEIHDRLIFLWLVNAVSQPMDISEKSAMVFSPHQDDETLGCGGTIALKRLKNIPVKVVFLTNGQGSHAGHPGITPEELITIRHQEALTALNILGVSNLDINFLNYRDGAMRYYAEVKRTEIIEKLVNLIQAFQPEEIYVTHRQDKSKDHEATYELVQEAIAISQIQAQVFQYPIWIIWKSVLFRDLKLEHLAGCRRVSIHPVLNQKKQAIAAYRSQCEPIAPEKYVVLTPAFLQRFFSPHEVFFTEP